MSLHIVGIDIGTGSTKAVALTPTGQVTFTAQQSYPTLHPQPGYSEQDPEIIWQAFVQCVNKVSTHLKGSFIISLSSAMHSIIAVDEKGNPLTASITWADTRSADIAGQLKQSPIAEALYTATGTPVHSMSPLCKLIWMQQHTPDLLRRAYKFISIKEYIWHKLFNEYVIDYSLASATGLFHIINCQWHDEALKLASITAGQLSTPVDTSYQKNNVPINVANLLGIQADIVFIVGASDGCLANVGSFALTPDSAALTIGTSGAVRITSPHPITDFNAMLFNYRLDNETFVCGGPINNGGIVMQWLLKTFLGKEATPEAYSVFFEMVEAVPAGSEGLIFLPYLSGERAPVWDAKSSGVFLGITLQHQMAHFLKAGVEGICYALFQVLEIIENLSGPVAQLNVSGGFIHSTVWMQLLADITGKPLCLVKTEDASAIGAAYLAMKALHIIPAYSVLQTERPAIITPDAARHQMYLQYFSVYKKLYANLKETMHQLYSI